MSARTTRFILLAGILSLSGGQAHAQKAPAGGGRPARSGSGTTFGFALGLTTGMFQAGPNHQQYVNDYAIGFDMRVAVYPLRFLGLKAGAGVDLFRGPKGPNGHPASGSYGLADVALALRTPPPRRGFTLGLDVGLSTVFEPDYGYSYTSGNVIYVYPSVDLPLVGGPFLEASLRRGGLIGWQVSYRHFFGTTDGGPEEGRMRGRAMLAISVAR